jgi:hypothetical protein
MPLFGKEALQKLRTLFGEEPAAVGELWAETRIFGEIDDGSAGPRLRVFRGPHHEFEPGLSAESRAHGARFKGHIQGAFLESPIAGGPARLAQGQQFGVAGRVPEFHAAVPGTGDDLGIANHHGADRDLAALAGSFGLRHRLGHEPMVVVVENPVRKHVGSIAKGPLSGPPVAFNEIEYAT